MHHRIETTIDIDATADEIWDVLVDLDRYADWNPFVVRASGHVAVGERLDVDITPPGGRRSRFRPVVTEVDPHRSFEWLGRLPVPGMFQGRHRFELSPLGDGATRLIHSEDFRGLLVRALRRSLDTGAREGFVAMNRALADRVDLRRRRSSSAGTR